MILPTIHLNGTSAEILLDGYRAAMEATRAAIDALGKVEFSARDYYVQEAGAWEKAEDDRREMFVALSKIHQDLLAHAVHANSSIMAKEARRLEREKGTA